MTDIIAETLNVAPKNIVHADKMNSIVPSDEDEFIKTVADNKKIDYIKVRDNLHNIIDEVSLVVNDAVEEVRSSPSARLYETFALLVKTYAELNKDLLTINTIEPHNHNTSPTTAVNNNVMFVGTSDNLIDTIKAKLYEKR